MRSASLSAMIAASGSKPAAGFSIVTGIVTGIVIGIFAGIAIGLSGAVSNTVTSGKVTAARA